ncbi:MAG: ATP-binding protein [Campylobacterota bacterium]|nr:ATP-binding protein [Campylobacterota bacterium]
MFSPFPYDNITSNSQFFGRVKEIEKISEIVKYSNNLLIHSKRRMGKTSLVKEFFEKNKDRYLCIYVDIFDITSKEDFSKALLTALSNSTKLDLKGAIKSLTSLFKRVRVEPTIDPKTLEYSIKPIVTTLTFEQMLEDFFYTISEYSKNQQIIIAIDEFQQIANITDVKLDAILRKYIQERENISYIFLGSKRHLLTSLFQYKAPLYELANHFELQPLNIEDIKQYSTQYLILNDKLLDYIYEESDGETKMLQHILHLLYIQKQKTITKEQVDDTIQEIINSKDSSYKIIFDTLNNNQKIALKIVVKYKNGFFNSSVLSQYNIKKQTLQSSVNTLFAKELIDKNDDKYFIPDRVFEFWVRRII